MIFKEKALAVDEDFTISQVSVQYKASAVPAVLVAFAAKSLQSCLTLCHPIDGSPPGSAIPGILQARTLEWVAIAFSLSCFQFGKIMKEVPINIHGKTFILVQFSIYFVKILKNSFSGSYDKYILYKNIMEQSFLKQIHVQMFI